MGTMNTQHIIQSERAKLTLFPPLRLLLVEGHRPPIHFTPTEFQIISLLFECQEQVIRDKVLMAKIEGFAEITESVSSTNLLERHVGAIRAKLEQPGIGASVYRVRGKGYVFLWEGSEQSLLAP